MATGNRPERFDLFTLGETQAKLTFTKDENMTAAGTFRIFKEDHTLGNLIRMQLLRDKNILFAGYKVPHPLETEIVVKVRTKAHHHPVGQMLVALNHLTTEVNSMEAQFRSQIDEKKQQMLI